jgi:hypothetical protein
MPRAARLHYLNKAEQKRVEYNLKRIDKKIQSIYTLAELRFGSSNKRSVRLQALKRKLLEVEKLFAVI